MKSEISIDAKKRFCVYFHWCEDEVIYIGSGTYGRAFTWENKRDAYHLARSGRGIRIEIVQTFADRLEAYASEAVYIAALAPVGNTHGKDPAFIDEHLLKLGRPPADTKPVIRCMPEGTEFKTLSAAASATGVSKASVSWSMKYRKPLVTYGIWFERI